MKFLNRTCGALGRLAGPMLLLMLLMPGWSQGQEMVERTWGVGWDNGLTVRTWLGGRWELAVSAGPDDYLRKEETRSWYLNAPEAQHGLLEVPQDIREEHGWVRFQAGRLIKKKNQFAVVGYGGVLYEWIVHQERSLMLQEVSNLYDTFELDRHTQRWIFTLGLRPSWQPVSFLTIEAAFGLNFVVEDWDQTTTETWAGVDGHDYQELDGHGQQFDDFGIDGMASIQIFLWL